MAPEPLLRAADLSAGYGRKTVVFDVDLEVAPGEIVTVLGHNGAGKTTTLKTIFGMLPVVQGEVTYDGQDATNRTCRANVVAGMSFIPSERFVFPELTVRENLLLGALHESSSSRRDERMEYVHKLFPILAERSGQRAGTFSGGQQRMLSLGLALMSSPRLLLLDEPSLGLAPALVRDVFDTVRRLVDEDGLSILLLEQKVGQALRIADRAYVMRAGRIVLEKPADVLRDEADFWELF